MKCTVIIDEGCEEEVRILARRRTPLVEALERIAASADAPPLMGFDGTRTAPLSVAEIVCFTVEDNRIFARTAGEKWLVKHRLYQLEESLGAEFLKINQSCLANPKKILRFEATVSGALRVVFAGGYTDYVSRRQMKTVKERFGF